MLCYIAYLIYFKLSLAPLHMYVYRELAIGKVLCMLSCCYMQKGMSMVVVCVCGGGKRKRSPICTLVR